MIIQATRNVGLLEYLNFDYIVSYLVRQKKIKGEQDLVIEAVGNKTYNEERKYYKVKVRVNGVEFEYRIYTGEVFNSIYVGDTKLK